MFSGLEAEIRVPDVCVSLSQHDWASPTFATAEHEDNRLLLFLPPIGFRGKVRSPAAGLDRFTPVAPTYFWPCGVPLESQGTGGHVRLVRHSFTRRRLQAVLEDDCDWGPAQLQRGLDLQHAGVAPLLLRMLQELLSPGLASRALIDAMSTAAIVELARHMRGASAETDGRGRLTRLQMGRLRDRIAAEDRPAPTVAELAQLCGMGERHLLRLFKATTGETVSGFIRNAQTERARRMLSMTDLPMKEIAYRLGFSGPSSFAASFRKTTCDTPASFRDRTRPRLYAA